MHKYQGNNIPGIPRAPVMKFHNVVQHNYEKMKERYTNKIPLLSEDEILKSRKPYHYLLQKLVMEGYEEVVDEILQLKLAEEKVIFRKHEDVVITTEMTNLLTHVTDILKYCYDTEAHKKYMESAKARFHIAEELFGKKDSLARHFLQTALATSKLTEDPDDHSLEFQAKLHCLLAFIEKRKNVESSIHHLEKARNISREKSWWFQSRLIQVEIDKPVSICELREGKETTNCSTLSIYKVATLLYCDILMNIIKSTVLSNRDDFDVVFHLSKEILEMAHEIRNPTLIASALTRYGKVLADSGAFSEALLVFQQLSHESEICQDYETLAISYGNIAQCLHGSLQPLESLEWLHNQNELATQKGFNDIHASGVQQMGRILLEEGQLIEAEQCICEAYQEFTESIGQEQQFTPWTQRRRKKKKGKELCSPEDSIDTSWAMSGLTSGMCMLGRYTGLCRQNEHLNSVLDWKDRREFMTKVPRPPHTSTSHVVYDYFDHLDEHKIPSLDDCDINCWTGEHKNFFKTFEWIADVGHLPVQLEKRKRVPHHRRIRMSGDSQEDGGYSFESNRCHRQHDHDSSPSRSDSMDSLESIVYVSDRHHHQQSFSSSEGTRKNLSLSSSMGTLSMTDGKKSHQSWSNLDLLNKNLMYHNRKSVMEMQTHKNIIAPAVVSTKNPMALSFGPIAGNSLSPQKSHTSRSTMSKKSKTQHIQHQESHKHVHVSLRDLHSKNK